MRSLRIGVPSKGRLSEIASDLLHQAGLSFRRQERGLFARVREIPIDVTFLRTDDIPVLCAEGAIDMGITGSDLVAESQVDVQTRLSLGVGHCRLAICVPEDSSIQHVQDLQDVTSPPPFPQLTQQYLQQHQDVSPSGPPVGFGGDHGRPGRGRRDRGSGRDRQYAWPPIAYAFWTRSASFESVLIQHPILPAAGVGGPRRPTPGGVVIARSYSLLEYNILRQHLAEAEQITPGFDSPTVNSLEDPPGARSA